MKTHYVLPLCFAAATHGALLFGFSKSPRPHSSEIKDPTILTPFVLRPVEEPVVVDHERVNSEPKVAPDVPQPPRTAEPLVVDVGVKPTMPVPVLPSVDVKNMAKDIVPAVSGAGGNGDNPWGKILDSVLLDNPPRTRVQAAPMYPHEAKQKGMGGQVLVEFMVDERGSVIDPRIVNSSDRMFEEATLRAVAKWKFEPGRRDGRIVRFRMSAPVVFNLND